MKAVFCACCETCVEDVRTRVISMINIIDELSAVTFPIAIPKLTMVTVSTRTASEPDVVHARLRASLNGNKLFEINTPIEFQGKLRSRTVAELQGIPLAAPGILRMSVLDPADVEMAGWDIAVLSVGAPQVNLFTVNQEPPAAATTAAAAPEIAQPTSGSVTKPSTKKPSS